MIILGVSVLGNLNKEATSQKSLGTSFWRIVISSGILSLIFGVVNIFASYIFRHKKEGITAREVRAHGATSAQKSVSSLKYSTSSAATSRRRSFRLGRSDTLPSYYTQSPKNVEVRQSRNISAPVNVDHSQFERFKGAGSVAVQRPDSALHPAFQQGGNRF